MKSNLFKRILRLFVAVFTGAFVFVSSCKKEVPEPAPCFDETNPKCENYNPCSVTEPVSAKFDILSQISVSPAYRDSFTLVNKVSGFGLIKFVANEKNAKNDT